MAATVGQFKPSVTPETWITPITACRFSTLTTAARYQTLDEYFTKPSGATFGKTARKRIMSRLRVYGAEHRGESVTEADGYNRDDGLFAYRKMFPGWKVHKLSPRPKDILSLLRAGYFLSISGNVGRTPSGSILRRYVNPVAHEIGLARLNKAGDKVLVYEPMRPDKPVWVPWSHVKAFSSAFTFDSGRRICIGIKIAWATAAEFMKRSKERAVKRLRATVQDERTLRQATEDMLESAQLDIATLERQLEECEENPGDTWDRALTAGVEALEALREDGPPDG